MRKEGSEEQGEEKRKDQVTHEVGSKEQKVIEIKNA